MPWDSDKSTAQDPDNPNADEQLTADEWDAHVNEGHFPADQLNFGTNAEGDPIMTDPQTGDTVMQWDRSAGQWVLPAVSTESLDSTKRAGWGEPVETINKSNTGSATDTITLSDPLIEGDELLFDIIELQPSGAAEVRLSSPQIGDGGYIYQLSNSTSPATAANYWLLNDTDANHPLAGDMRLRASEGGRPALLPDINSVRDSTTVIERGAGTVFEPDVADLVFEANGATEFSSIEMAVYRREVSV